MDGDVQGVRTVIRSKGEDLKSEYWVDIARSVLPLHRAISGLHFHGSEKLLVGTLETLMHLGANASEQDHAGSTALHKAIRVCTSKSVVSVVQTLLSRGAKASLRNSEGDTPLHSECKR
jgi:ankyrin repeat protein